MFSESQIRSVFLRRIYFFFFIANFVLLIHPTCHRYAVNKHPSSGHFKQFSSIPVLNIKDIFTTIPLEDLTKLSGFLLCCQTY